MRPFAALERFFERLFERPSARLFHAKLQPIQLQRRVERAMENGRFSASDRVVVPNRYLVRLATSDLRAFGDFADSLELELADAALRFARAHRYTVSDRPAVRLVADNTLDAGDVAIDATFSDVSAHLEHGDAAEGEAGHRRSLRPAPGSSSGNPSAAGGSAGIRAAGRPRGTAEAAPGPARGAAVGFNGNRAARPASSAGVPPATRAAGIAQIDGTRTMIFQVPTVDSPLAVLREVAPDGSQRALNLDGGPVSIGRATDNNLVLQDSRVSRYHGRLTSRQGALVYSDLGSTNGSRVNGVEIDEVVLGAGDRIELGDTILVVESVATA